MMVAKKRTLITAVLVCTLASAAALSADVARRSTPAAPPAPSVGPAPNWIDHFDTYAADTQLHGVGGWEGWGNSAAAGAFTRTAQARTPANSVEILGASDLVHPYTGYTTGTWTYTAWQYIPTGTTGDTYFIMLNTYNNDAACTGCNWSVQVIFQATGDIVNEGATSGTSTIVYDT